MRVDEEMRRGPGMLVESATKGRKDGIVMVEIGSYRGESAELFLATGKVSRIYCVDPWRMFYDPQDGAAYTNMKAVEADFDRRHANDKRVVKVKGTIDDFVERYVNGPEGPVSVDLVYVDGCHTYEAVKHDILTAVEHIKPKIAMSGHDWGWGGDAELARAVKETVGEPDEVFPDSSWLKRNR